MRRTKVLINYNQLTAQSGCLSQLAPVMRSHVQNNVSSMDNYSTKRCSCFFLDIRNSINIIRTISLKSDEVGSSRIGNTATAKKMLAYSQFMLDIHKFLFEKLAKLNIDDYYFNNTGDGHVCLVWNKTHAWTILNVACSISVYLEKRMEEYYTQHLRYWEQEYGKELSIGFGIGMHSGESIIIKEKVTNTKFAYGIVLNTAARTESFTKNFPKVNLLFTEHFKRRLEDQYHFLEFPKKSKWAEYEKIISAVTNFPINTKDSKSTGHLLYTIKETNLSHFIKV